MNEAYSISKINDAKRDYANGFQAACDLLLPILEESVSCITDNKAFFNAWLKKNNIEDVLDSKITMPNK